MKDEYPIWMYPRAVRRLWAKLEKIIVDVQGGQPQLLENAAA
jgi:hypothetical protein